MTFSAAILIIQIFPQIVSMRGSIKQARVHIINHNGRRIKELQKYKKTDKKSKKRALKLSQEIKALKVGILFFTFKDAIVVLLF